MTFLRLKSLDEHWGKHPPLNQMVQAFCGFKVRDPEQMQDADSFFSQMG